MTRLSTAARCKVVTPHQQSRSRTNNLKQNGVSRSAVQALFGEKKRKESRNTEDGRRSGRPGRQKHVKCTYCLTLEEFPAVLSAFGFPEGLRLHFCKWSWEIWLELTSKREKHAETRLPRFIPSGRRSSGPTFIPQQDNDPQTCSQGH